MINDNIRFEFVKNLNYVFNKKSDIKKFKDVFSIFCLVSLSPTMLSFYKTDQIDKLYIDIVKSGKFITFNVSLDLFSKHIISSLTTNRQMNFFLTRKDKLEKNKLTKFSIFANFNKTFDQDKLERSISLMLNSVVVSNIFTEKVKFVKEGRILDDSSGIEWVEFSMGLKLLSKSLINWN